MRIINLKGDQVARMCQKHLTHSEMRNIARCGLKLLAAKMSPDMILFREFHTERELAVFFSEIAKEVLAETSCN